MKNELREALKLLRDYIKKNPEVLKNKEVDVTSLTEEELKQLQKEQEKKNSELNER